MYALVVISSDIPYLLISRRVILNRLEDEEDDAFLPPSPLSVCDRNMNPKCQKRSDTTEKHGG